MSLNLPKVGPGVVHEDREAMIAKLESLLEVTKDNDDYRVRAWRGMAKRDLGALKQGLTQSTIEDYYW